MSILYCSFSSDAYLFRVIIVGFASGNFQLYAHGRETCAEGGGSLLSPCMCAIPGRLLHEVIEDTNRRFWGCAFLGTCIPDQALGESSSLWLQL